MFIEPFQLFFVFVVVRCVLSDLTLFETI